MEKANNVYEFIKAETERTTHGIGRVRLCNHYYKIYSIEELNKILKELLTQNKIKRYENPTGAVYTTNV